MTPEFVPLEEVDENNELARTAAHFANAAYCMTKQIKVNGLSKQDESFYFPDRQKLHEALDGIRAFAVGRDCDVERLKMDYLVASYTLTLVVAYVIQTNKDYSLHPLASWQRVFAQELLRQGYAPARAD